MRRMGDARPSPDESVSGVGRSPPLPGRCGEGEPLGSWTMGMPGRRNPSASMPSISLRNIYALVPSVAARAWGRRERSVRHAGCYHWKGTGPGTTSGRKGGPSVGAGSTGRPPPGRSERSCAIGGSGAMGLHRREAAILEGLSGLAPSPQSRAVTAGTGRGPSRGGRLDVGEAKEHPGHGQPSGLRDRSPLPLTSPFAIRLPPHRAYPSGPAPHPPPPPGHSRTTA